MTTYDAKDPDTYYPPITSLRPPTGAPNVLIVLIDDCGFSASSAFGGPIYYANAMNVRERINTMITGMQPPPRAVVLDSGAQDNLDITSAEMLKSLLKELKSKGITVYAAGVHAPVREAAHGMGLFEFISEDHGFPTVDAAVNFLEMSNQSEKD